jgi:hypothetical protein
MNRRKLLTAAFAVPIAAPPFTLLSHTAIAAPVARTPLMNAAPVSVPVETLITVPPTGGASVPAVLPYASVEMSLNLSTADKLAVGNTVALYVRRSTDGGTTWTFVAGYPLATPWTSYGPNGLTIMRPDGTVVVNPDPTIVVALNGLGNFLLDIQAQFHGITSAGATINGIGAVPT